MFLRIANRIDNRKKDFLIASVGKIFKGLVRQIVFYCWSRQYGNISHFFVCCEMNKNKNISRNKLRTATFQSGALSGIELLGKF